MTDSIASIREAKKKLESDIINLITNKVTEFQSTYGVEIADILISGTQYYTVGVELGEWLPTSVVVQIEI